VRTEIYASDGALIGTLSREDRRIVPLHEVNPALVQAIVATEDRNFYRHWGVDPVGLVRALVHNVTNFGGPLHGGSTITQQLAWNLFLTHEQTVSRKLKELVLTLRLERSFSKDEILELYLNEIYFGDVYGVETASRYFFGKSAAEVSLSEAAVLAGVPKHPARYSPKRNPERAKARRNVVLNAMLETGAITQSQYEQAVAEPLRVAARRDAPASQAPHFVELIRTRLVEEYGDTLTYEGGLHVETTLDLALQGVCEKALEAHLSELEEMNKYEYLRAASSTGTGSVDAPSARLQGAVVLLDAKTAAIRALVGGRDFAESEFNRAIQARRQPGSAFKPFIFAQAIKEGHRLSDVVDDAPLSRSLPNGERWEPQNYSRTFHGPVTLRTAFARSINIPAVLLLEEVGVNDVIATAHDLGIESPLPKVLSLALGSGEVSLLELTASYAPFLNAGIYTKPYSIERIEDRSGGVRHQHQVETREALDENVAFLVLDLMQTVVDHGTGHRVRDLGLTGDAAGKTGTTNDYTDAWFVGFNSEFVCGVWVGFDKKVPIGPNMTGTACALPVWTEIMKSTLRESPPQPFRAPGSITRLAICLDSGLIAMPYCPNVATAAFQRGSQPTTTCTLHTAPIADPVMDGSIEG
jgi:penicillin-binding protein 1A